MSYDSRPATQEHVDRVRDFLNDATNNLSNRAERHDASKLVSPEVEAFDIATPKLAGLVYGSPEYHAATAELGPALAHHYAANDHHPQHFENGVDDMSLMAVIEMLCDWRAASERTKGEDGQNASEKFRREIAFSFERFGIGPQLASILLATVEELGL